MPGEAAADSPIFVMTQVGAAATVVRAGNANGRIEWKVEGTGQAYQDWYEQKLKAAGVETSE